MISKRLLLICLAFITVCKIGYADNIAISHFIVKDNPFGKNELAVVATDSLNNPQENINGVFNFTINGFSEELTFDKGVAFYHHKLERSIFLYVKHIDDQGTHAMLYYIYKHDDKLSPWHISWVWLLVIPLALILFGYLFKRFLIIAVIVFIIFFYFNHHNGLSLPTFFESIIDGLKNLF